MAAYKVTVKVKARFESKREYKRKRKEHTAIERNAVDCSLANNSCLEWEAAFSFVEKCRH